MQTFEALIRRCPDRSQLSSLRTRVLSDEPEQELDLALHKAFCRFPAEFIEVAASLIYQVPDQLDYKIQKPQWLWSRNDSIGWVDDVGTTHYWEGERPGFWDDLMPIPRYTTRVEDALDLKWTLLGSDVQIVLEERVTCDRDEDGPTFTRDVSASVLGADQECLSTAEYHVAAMAIIVAMIDFLLSITATV